MKYRLPDTAQWTVAELMSHNPGMNFEAAKHFMYRMCRAGTAQVVVKGCIHHVAVYAHAAPIHQNTQIRTRHASSVFDLAR